MKLKLSNLYINDAINYGQVPIFFPEPGNYLMRVYTGTPKVLDRESIWLCKDGREMKVYEMDLGHLKNSAFKVARDNWRPSWLPVLVQELRDRNEHTVADEVMSAHKMSDALRLQEVY